MRMHTQRHTYTHICVCTHTHIALEKSGSIQKLKPQVITLVIL